MDFAFAMSSAIIDPPMPNREVTRAHGAVRVFSTFLASREDWIFLRVMGRKVCVGAFFYFVASFFFFFVLVDEESAVSVSDSEVS